MGRYVNGFTLIEMMVVLSIITILGLMTVPTYMDRIVRQQIEAAMPLADIAKKPIAAAWASTKTFPADNAAADLPAADKIVNNYVSNLLIQDGAIHITFGNRVGKGIQGKILSLRPAVIEDAQVVPVTWVCGNGTAPGKMTVKGNNLTTMPDILLPMECRKLSK